MSLVHRSYAWFRRVTSRPDEQGLRSAGRWQDEVRQRALGFLGDTRGKVLEVGCGEGLFLAQLARLAPDAELYGVDTDARRMRIGEERCAAEGVAARFFVEDAVRLSFADGSFDAVVCINVFFNMPSFDVVRQALQEMSRVCRPGGRIICDYRNAANPLLRAKYRLAPLYDATVKALPLKPYTAAQIAAALGEAGLTAARAAYVPSWCGKTALLARYAPVVIIEAEKL